MLNTHRKFDDTWIQNIATDDSDDVCGLTTEAGLILIICILCFQSTLVTAYINRLATHSNTQGLSPL